MFRIEKLDPELAQVHLCGIMRIEQKAIEKLGGVFSHEIWGERQVLMDLPGKWDISFICLDAGIVCGYLIATRVNDDYAHINRIAVDEKCRSQGVGAALLGLLHKKAKEIGFERICLFVNSMNTTATQFYKRFGYEIMTGDKLKQYAQLKGRKDIRFDCVYDESRTKFRAFELEIK